MDNIVAIRYEGDGSLEESQKLSVLRFINRVLAGQREAIIASNAFVRVKSEKGKLVSIEVIGTNAELARVIASKISNSGLPF